MSQHAFALVESARDSFVDASVVVQPNGETLSIGERLKAGHGYIVTDSEQEAEALSLSPVLESVPVSKAKSATKPAAKAKGKDES